MAHQLEMEQAAYAINMCVYKCADIRKSEEQKSQTQDKSTINIFLIVGTKLTSSWFLREKKLLQKR